MINRKTIYCEYDFWKEFSESYPTTVTPNADMMQYMQCWINIFSLCCKSNMKLDITSQDLLEKTKQDKFLKMLWKKSSDGCCGLDCIKEKFPHVRELSAENVNDENLNAVYMTTEEKENCLKTANRLGVVIINKQEIVNCDLLFRDNGKAIRKNEKNTNNWHFLKRDHFNNCNCLIIVDNYLLSDTNSIKENLPSILDALLPIKTTIPFNISFFCFEMKNNEKERYILVDKIIKDLRNDLTYNLTLYKCENGAFHDRAIISNNYWISCGGGFDLFKKGRSTKSTTVNITFPFLQSSSDWVDEAYLNLIKDALKVDNNAIQNNQTHYCNYWGNNKENRLLRYYTQPTE